ncbi:MAG TPA: RDD family protein [Planctomycetes bacterium]|nr:RDD family protein [Planctomycetota bacterium]
MDPSQTRNSLLFRRAVAFLMDLFLLGLVQGIFLVLILLPLFVGEDPLDRFVEKVEGNPAIIMEMILAYFGVILFFFVFSGFYFILLQSSTWQATLGKRMLGLKVTDLGGNPIGFGTALMRYFVRVLLSSTGLLILADFIVGFTNDEGQTIHDLAARTRVFEIKESPPPLGR